MIGLKRMVVLGAGAALIGGSAVAASGPQPAATRIASIDLARAFGTRSPWRFTASQGPAMPDPIGVDESVPGPIRLCIGKGENGPCQPDLGHLLRVGDQEDLFSVPHFLRTAEILHPRGAAGRALLLLRVVSLYSGDSDQRVATQVLAYDRARDRFVGVYRYVTGHNNNQEARYVDRGPLKGAMISAQPAEHAPFGFWITVSRLTPAYTYRQVLRYLSATRYGDGNPLAVIDSEMPGIQQRLGLWRPGMPLPLPAGGCAKPRLVRMELWCG